MGIMNNKDDYSSVNEQGNNLAKFSLELINYLKKGDDDELETLLVPDDTYNKRLKICSECNKFESSQSFCQECGCHIPIKATYVLESCPLDKWLYDDNEWEKIFNNILNDMNKKNDKQ